MLCFEKDYGFGLPVSLHPLIKFKAILGGSARSAEVNKQTSRGLLPRC